MSTALTPSTQPTTPDPSVAALLAPRNWKMPVVYGILALVAVLWFGLGAQAGAHTVFRFSKDGDFLRLPDLVVGAKAATLSVGIVLLALAGFSWWSVARRVRTGAWLPIVFGVLFVFGFLAWAGADHGVIATTSLLAGGLTLSVPLIFGAMSGLVGERSGIVNIAIEGQLLAGAFVAAVTASLAGNPYAGLVAAPLGGIIVAVILVFFAVKYWVDQIIIGVVINVLVTGITSFLFSSVLAKDSSHWNTAFELPKLPIPGLAQIPVLGPVLFDQNLLVYLMYVVVIALHILVFRSKWGLRMRAIGEHPKAADTVGIKVNRWRVINTLIAGAFAGLGGAFLTIGSGLAFAKDMSAGQGYIALAAMILGKWNPLGALFAALLFGFVTNLGNALQAIGSPLPSDLLSMLPYIVTIFAVAGFVGRVRAPAAEGQPYAKQ
jgi:ABC-type uncharacterized transport system permease subunit